MKVVKFRDYLIPLVVSGKKTSTWRLFDEKNLSVGDKIGLREFGKEENFAQAIITKVVVTKFKDLKSEDRLGHEKYVSDEDMYKTYSSYYHQQVGPETELKILWFRLV